MFFLVEENGAVSARGLCAMGITYCGAITWSVRVTARIAGADLGFSEGGVSGCNINN